MRNASCRGYARITLAASLLVWPGLLSAQDLYAPRTDWSAFSGGRLNISAFVYRDGNRNGFYDLDDRPLEDIAVAMTAPGGASATRWSNSNGFANFSMSAKDATADITSAGDYLFEVIVPGEWVHMGGPLKQTKHFDVFPGAVADMVATPPFVAVGLAQVLSIDGVAPTDVHLSVTSPAAETSEVAVDADGRFTVPAFEGEWTFEASYPAGPLQRAVTVTDTPIHLSAGFLNPPLEPLTGPPTLVDFESITEKDIREIPNGVGGLNWWNFVVLKLASSYNNNAVSGNHVAYNSSGHPGRISSANPFDFVGGHFGVAWKRANGEELIIEGWRNNELKYEDRITLSNLGPVWFEAEYRDIDRLELRSAHYWQFVADDLVFRTGER